MSCYEALAGSYDALTEDVGYGKRLDFIEKLLCRSRIPVKLVLDLACGTGTMSWLLTQQGYEVIVVDGSEDLLLVTRAGILIRTPVEAIRTTGRATQGVIVMRFKEEGDSVISMALTEHEESEE